MIVHDLRSIVSTLSAPHRARTLDSIDFISSQKLLVVASFLHPLKLYIK